MKQKLLTIKALLVAVLLGVGVNGAWAVNNDDYGVDLDTYDKTTYDFTSMSGDLAIDTSADPYTAWSTRANNYEGGTVNVYPCTTTGMSKFAFEAVGGDAWQFWSTNGLGNKTRVYAAAVTGLKNGNIVVFVYLNSGKVNFGNTASGTGPYTLGDEATDSNGKYYKKATMTSDGVIGFDMNKINGTPNAGYIRQIHIYTVKGVCADPTYQITGANGNARTFTLSCETAASTIYYSTSELASASGGTEYTGAVETEATKIWAYAKTSSSTSGVINFNTGAGSYVQVNGATFANPYYDVASGKWCVKVKEDQTSVVGKPTVTLKYYTTAPESKTDCTAENFITGFDFGATVYVEASADNYSSRTTSYTFPSSLAVGNRIATWTDEFTSGGTLTYGASETMGNVSCAPITAVGETALSGNFGAYGTQSNWSCTTNGLYTGSTYYTGAKNLSTSGLLKIVVNEATFLEDKLSGRKNASLNYTEKNTDGTYSMYFNVSGSSACFNGKGGQTILSVSFMNSVSKNITDAGWATFCSPYDLDLEHATGLTDAYIVTGGNGTALEKTSVMSGTVAANTGLLLKAEEGTVTIPAAVSGTDYSASNKLVGVTVATPKTQNTAYVLMPTGTNGLGFYLNGNATDFTVGANTAYLPADFDGLSAPALFYSLFDSETTGVNEVRSKMADVRGEYYNLAGQRVANPTKGLYIVNGKKIVLK